MNKYKSIIIVSLMSIVLLGCSAKVEKVPYPVYQTLECEDAVKPSLLPLDENQYISSKTNIDRLLANFNSLNTYVERLLQQIQCYKSQVKNVEKEEKEN